MDMKIDKNFINVITKDEEELKLENLFTTGDLIDFTNFSLRDNLELDNNYIKAVDRTIDDLYLLYTESVKTRYILISTCTYNLLKHFEPDVFVPFHLEYNSSDNNVKAKPKPIAKFLKEVSDLMKDRLVFSETQLSNKYSPLVSEYILKLTEELFLMTPVHMSDGFKALNSKILQTIE